MKIIEEAREEQKMPVGVQLQRQLFTRHTTKRVNAGATKAIVKASELFFEQLMDDLKAYTQHSDRTKVTLQDMKLLMQRQRLITKTKAVELLAHTHLPREMWDLVCRSATANNELFPDHLE
ncbi:hypothetical protein BDF14DRAFT_1541368 [Spinellus fusiger]|nr:hypothetical protein BDF14DRAFT_1541368 [Spinellus fusiger]